MKIYMSENVLDLDKVLYGCYWVISDEKKELCSCLNFCCYISIPLFLVLHVLTRTGFPAGSLICFFYELLLFIALYLVFGMLF